ncbi:MAG: hypothetical protein EXR53_02530 [Dehalococcoidia bacterium]|nr:hypothetical protein [Dehalococcoidia bacterium]
MASQEEPFTAHAGQLKQTHECLATSHRVPEDHALEPSSRALPRRLILARRVIFITGDIVNHADREFVTATGNPVIEKPFHLNTLQKQLESLLNNES